MGISVDEFWSMTSIEFWDFYCGYSDKARGGPPVKKMTVEWGNELEDEIEKRLKKKGKSLNG